MDIKAQIIPKPVEGTRLVVAPHTMPAIKGKGDINYLCGNCNTKIVEKVNKGQVHNIVILCSVCGNYNEIA